MMSAKPKLRTVSGLPPLTYKAKKADYLTNYRIYGQTVDGESVGDRTGNLFDEAIYNKNVQDNMIIYVPIYVGNIDYVTCSTTCPKTITGDVDSINSRYIFILSGNVNTGAQNAVNGVSNGAPLTIQPSNGYVTIAYRKLEGYDVRPWEYQTMLNVGYKVSMTVEGKNLAKNNYAKSSTLFTVEEVNNFIHVTGTNNSGSVKAFVISKDNIFPAGSYDIVNNSDTVIGYDYKDENDTLVYGTVGANSIKTFNFPAVFTRYLNINKSVLNGESIDNYFQVMIVKHGDDTNTYEPYHVPITTPIYLPEQIRKVGDEAEYIDYGEQKFVKKFYKITLNFDDMNNDERFPGWSGGTAVVEYCNKIRSLAINAPDGYMPFQYSSISNFKAIVNVRNNRSILFLGASSVIGHTQSELKEIYAGQSITFILKMPDTNLDVTLPTLPTLTGTNVLSVGTGVQPSSVEIEGRIKPVVTGGG